LVIEITKTGILIPANVVFIKESFSDVDVTFGAIVAGGTPLTDVKFKILLLR
jgi:hypothetical protein